MNIRNEYKDGVIQTRRWENLLDFSAVFSGWFTSAVERACERTVDVYKRQARECAASEEA